MMRRLIMVLAVLSLALALFVPTLAAEGTTRVMVAGVQRFDYAREVYREVNAVRKKRGLSPLGKSRRLGVMAMQRAAEISLYYSHTRPNGREWSTINGAIIRGRPCSYTWSRYGENIARGQASPCAVMTGWMESEGHRANILSPRYTQAGMGCFERDGVLYWVQIFGNGRDAASGSDSGVVRANVEVEVRTSMLLR